MRVEPATSVDLPTVRAAYDEGRAIQREQGSSVWPAFTDAAILEEVGASRLFRVVDGAEPVGVLSVAYRDDAIWGELEQGMHLYLHRIARTKGYHGRGLMDAVLTWATIEGKRRGLNGLRMDTWASNASLIAYYRRLGFRFVCFRRLGADPRLPAHYHGIELALLERPLDATVTGSVPDD